MPDAENAYADLMTRIKSGEWHIGNRLPGVLVLSRYYQISRHMITNVILQLAEEGWVKIQPRVGAVVLRTAERKFYTESEVAKMLGVRAATVREWIDAQTLRPHSGSRMKGFLVDEDALTAFLHGYLWNSIGTLGLPDGGL